jgi:Viral BACON domain
VELRNLLLAFAAARMFGAAPAPRKFEPRSATRRVVGLSWIGLLILSSFLCPLPAAASSNGISGFSGKSGSTCTSCHSNGTAPAVTLTGPTTVTSGSTNTYTISVSVVTAGNGGVDVAASAGTFAAGTGTKVLNGEIVHSGPSSTHSWTFSWTAPTVTTTTTATLFAAAIDSFGGGTGTLQRAITVSAPVTAPTILVSPASLTYNYQSGGTAPAAQNVAVSSSGSAFNYTVSTSATWLTASPTSGSTPGSVSVSVSPQSLSAGTYTGTVTITSAGASNNPKTVAVTLNVTAAALPTLGVSPASLTYNYQIGGSAPVAQSIALSSSGSAVSYTTATSATWLSATPPSGNTPATLSVSVNPSGLTAGTYNGNVTISSAGASNSPKSVPVTLNVTAAPPSGTLTVAPLSLSFNYQSGGATPAAQTVNLSSSSALSYSVTSSGSWLSVTPTSGSTPGSLSVSINPTGLAAGSYSGSVTVSATGASNSPQKVAVNLTVSSAPPTNPSLSISPGTLAFTYASGSSSSGTQNLSITSTGSALNLTIAASGGSWLTATPSSGSTPATVKITANPTGMAAGTYNGTITITATGAANSPQKVPVQLVVTGGGGGTGKLRVWPSRGVYFDYEAGHSDPSPRTVRVLSTGSALSFTAAAHGGTWVSVTPSGGTTPGSLSISVDPTGLASGTYSATISIAAPGAAALNLPVTLRVAARDDGGGDDGEERSTNPSGDQIRAWPYAYDPASTNTVAATWMDSTGVAPASSTNTSDTRNQGLLLSKTSAASNQAQAGVVLREVEGVSLTELGYDIRSGSQCTATSPRFVVVTSDDVVHKIGCASATTQPAPVTGWKRLRFDPSNPSQTVPAIAPGSKVKTMHLVLDGGPENGGSMVVLDNIDINGKFIGQQ